MEQAPIEGVEKFLVSNMTLHTLDYLMINEQGDQTFFIYHMKKMQGRKKIKINKRGSTLIR